MSNGFDVRHIVEQVYNITPNERAKNLNQKPVCLWLTGLSGSGKSTIANELDRKLHDQGYATFVLDGDNVRHGLCKDLGMVEADRAENIRRVGEVAKLMVDAGLIIVCAFISPYESDRRKVRELFGAGEFIEVFVNTPLNTCEARDVKGLYEKARNGIIKNFTGIDDPYEPPVNPEIVVTTDMPIKDTVKQVYDKMVYDKIIEV